MKVSKKGVATVAAVLLSGSMIAATGLAMSANLEGYNLFKKNLITAESSYSQDTNYSTTSFMSISKDGQLLCESSDIHAYEESGKMNSKRYTKTIATMGDTTVGVENWDVNDGVDTEYSISKVMGSDQYQKKVMELSDEEKQWRREYMQSSNDNESYSYTPSPAMENFMGALIDLVAGDAKNYFQTDGNTISCRLEGAQIPEIAQLGLTAALAELANESQDMESYSANLDSATKVTQQRTQAIVKEVLSLQDVKFELIEGSAPNNAESMLDNAHFEFGISGYDQNGVKHTYTADWTGETIKGNASITLPELSAANTVEETIKSGDNQIVVTEHGVTVFKGSAEDFEDYE